MNEICISVQLVLRLFAKIIIIMKTDKVAEHFNWFICQANGWVG